MATPSPKDRTGTAELSKVPSWILLGFVIGGAFVLLLRREDFSADGPRAQPVVEIVGAGEPPVFKAPSTVSTERKGEPSLTTIEAVWALWGVHAIWEADTTQVALWNVETSTFADAFEVTRRGDQVYFRTLTRLTRPVVDRGLGIQSPLQFTGPAVINPRR